LIHHEGTKDTKDTKKTRKKNKKRKTKTEQFSLASCYFVSFVPSW